MDGSQYALRETDLRRRLTAHGATLAMAVAVIVIAAADLVNAGEPAERVTLTGNHADQQFVAGEEVHVDAAVTDEIFAAGEDVTFDGASAETMIAAGRRLTVRSSAAENAIMAGGGLSFEGEIADDLVAAVCPFCPLASNRLHIRQAARIDDDARLAAGVLDIDGTIGGDLYAAAGDFTLTGKVAGNVSVLAERIVIDPGAQIGGDFSYRSPIEPEIAAGAVIEGDIVELEAPWLDEVEFERAGGSFWTWVVMAVAMVVFGAVVQLVAPGLVAAAGKQARERTWSSLGIGFLILVATPVAVGLLLISVVGAPLGVFVVPLLVVGLGFALATIASVIGDRLRRFGDSSPEAASTLQKLTWFAAGMIALAIIGAIPFVGGLFLLVAILIGLGAFCRQVLPLLRSPVPRRG